MKAIIASHREGKVLQFPMSKVINRTYGKKVLKSVSELIIFVRPVIFTKI